MEVVYNNHDGQQKSGKDKKKNKGKLHRAFKKFFSWFVPCVSSKATSVIETNQVHPESSPNETPIASESQSSHTSTPKKTKKAFRLFSKKVSKSGDVETEKNSQQRPAAVLGGLGMYKISTSSDNSGCSDLMTAKGTALIPKELYKVKQSSFYITSSENELEDSYEDSYEEDRLSGSFAYSSSSSIYIYDGFSSSEHTEVFVLPGSYPQEVAAGMQLPATDYLTLCSMEVESDGLTQAEILQMIQCSNEPPTQCDDGNATSAVQTLNIKSMGFPNIGNTCFMNSTLQCLLSIKPIVEDITTQQERWNNCSGMELLKALYDLHTARLSNTKKKEKAKILESIKDCIAKRNSDFEGDDQQDAHEFLMNCLAQLQEEAVMCQHFSSPEAHMEFKINRLRNCTTCGNQRYSPEDLNCLSLTMCPQQSLMKSLQRYFAASSFECRCSKCGSNGAIESAQFLTLPRVLVLLVMRIDMLTQRKITGCLAAPEELRLSSFLSDNIEKAAGGNSLQTPEDKTTYQLSGVVSHFGSSLHYGHYVSNIRDPLGAEWLKCDDCTVEPSSWSQTSKTIEKHGYMFFYVRS